MWLHGLAGGGSDIKGQANLGEKSGLVRLCCRFSALTVRNAIAGTECTGRLRGSPDVNKPDRDATTDQVQNPLPDSGHQNLNGALVHPQLRLIPGQ